MKLASFLPFSSLPARSEDGPLIATQQHVQLALLPDDEIIANGVLGRFRGWREDEGRRWLVLQTPRNHPRLAHQQSAQCGLPLYRFEADASLHVALRSDQLPSFEQLTRCDWGTRVTVRGQPARFSQAGFVDKRPVVVVLAHGPQPELKPHSWYCEHIGADEAAYYFNHDQTGLRIGTPVGTPLMQEQAATCLRRGDLLMVNGMPVTFMKLKQHELHHWLTLHAQPEQEPALRNAGAQPVKAAPHGPAWLLKWHRGLQVRLLSDSLPTFAQLRQMNRGTPVTLGTAGKPATLQGTSVIDGTRQFVLLSSAPTSDPAKVARETYRLRFQEAGLRLAGECGH